MARHLRPQHAGVAERRRDRIRDVEARRTHARDGLQRLEQTVHRHVLARQDVALAGTAALERRQVAVRDVLHVRVRPQPVARADDPRHLPRQVVGHHLHDDVAVGHVAGAVDDARVQDDDVAAGGRRLARDHVCRRLGALVVVARAAGVHERLVARRRTGRPQRHERRRVDDAGPRARSSREHVAQAAHVHAVERAAVGRPHLDHGGHVDDRVAALRSAPQRLEVGHVAADDLGVGRQPLEVAAGAREQAQRVAALREAAGDVLAQEAGRPDEQEPQRGGDTGGAATAARLRQPSRR